MAERSICPHGLPEGLCVQCEGGHPAMPVVAPRDIKTPEEKPRTPQPPTQPDPRYGWICPKCGGVFAPFVPKCDHCNKS